MMRDPVTRVLVMILQWWLRRRGNDVEIDAVDDEMPPDGLCDDDCPECGPDTVFVEQEIEAGVPYKSLATICASCFGRVDLVRDLDQDPDDEPWVHACGNVWVALWNERLPWVDFQVER